jgi:Tfp pilus assembly protein PilF
LPDAEQKCGAALERAVANDDQSFEAWQTMASYLISAQKPEEAKAAMEKSLALWFKGTPFILNHGFFKSDDLHPPV